MRRGRLVARGGAVGRAEVVWKVLPRQVGDGTSARCARVWWLGVLVGGKRYFGRTRLRRGRGLARRAAQGWWVAAGRGGATGVARGGRPLRRRGRRGAGPAAGSDRRSGRGSAGISRSTGRCWLEVWSRDGAEGAGPRPAWAEAADVLAQSNLWRDAPSGTRRRPMRHGRSGALGAVECAQLVDHEVRQHVRQVEAPKPGVERRDQQVPHLVVLSGTSGGGSRSVSGSVTKWSRPHRPAGRVPRLVVVAADEDARRDPAA